MKDFVECKNFLEMNLQRIIQNQIMQIYQTLYLTNVLKKFAMEQCKPVKTPM